MNFMGLLLILRMKRPVRADRNVHLEQDLVDRFLHAIQKAGAVVGIL